VLSISEKKNNFDYIDTDVAYLVGMIVARGAFHQDGDVRRLVIQFPYRHDAMTPVPGSQISGDRETGTCPIHSWRLKKAMATPA